MSLAIPSEGMAYNSVKVLGTAAGLAALTLANFNTGDSASDATTLNLYIDNSGTPAADAAVSLPDPVTLGVVGGTKLVIFNDTNGKKVTFTDPILSVVYDFVNKDGEYITLVSNGTNWVIG